MEREASLLRCSKLSSYAEFNRMVQAISRRSSGGSGLTPGINNMQGTSAEYYFYTTLSTMLRQVISNNSNPSSQRDELEMIYQWFCLNRPLIGRKTHPRSHRPSLSMVAPRLPLETILDRPQTAPAALYQPCPPPDPILQRPYTSPQPCPPPDPILQRPYTSHQPCPPPDPILQRPYTSPLRANKSFTSSFMSRSLSKDLDLVGRPFDRLIDLSRSAKQPLVESHSAVSSQERRQRSKSTSRRSSSLAVVNIPASNSLSGQPQRPSSVNIGAVFALAPSVAAQMMLDREMQRHHDARVRRVLSTAIGVTNRQTTNAPIPADSTCLEPKHGTEAVVETSLAKEQRRPLLSPDQITIQREPSLGREDVTQPVFEANPTTTSANEKNTCSDVSNPLSNPSVKETTSGEQDITLKPGSQLMASEVPADTRGSTANGSQLMASEVPADSESNVIETKPTPIRVTSITFSAQKLVPQSGGSRTSVSSHVMHRVPTPMSVVSISFPPSDEHPQTSHGNRQACMRKRTSITAAGFRYRPKTVARHTGTLA